MDVIFKRVLVSLASLFQMNNTSHRQQLEVSLFLHISY